jgi:hypothetical protein
MESLVVPQERVHVARWPDSTGETDGLTKLLLLLLLVIVLGILLPERAPRD